MSSGFIFYVHPTRSASPGLCYKRFVTRWRICNYQRLSTKSNFSEFKNMFGTYPSSTQIFE